MYYTPVGMFDWEMLVGRTSAGSNRIMEYRMKRSI